MSNVRIKNNTICEISPFLKYSKKEIVARKFKFKDGDIVKIIETSREEEYGVISQVVMVHPRLKNRKRAIELGVEKEFNKTFELCGGIPDSYRLKYRYYSRGYSELNLELATKDERFEYYMGMREK